jgi:hypothetical protein
MAASYWGPGWYQTSSSPSPSPRTRLAAGTQTVLTSTGSKSSPSAGENVTRTSYQPLARAGESDVTPQSAIESRRS